MIDRCTRHCSWRKVSFQCFRSYKWMKQLPGAWELLLAQRIQKIQNERWLWNVFSFSEILPCFWCSFNVPFIFWKLLIPLEDKTAANCRSELQGKKGDICMGGTEVPLVSLIFLKRSLVFPILLFSSVSLYWSLRKAFLSLLAIPWNSAFKWAYLSFSPLPLASLLFSAICKASSYNHFAFFAFLFLGDDLDHCLQYSVTNFHP